MNRIHVAVASVALLLAGALPSPAAEPAGRVSLPRDQPTPQVELHVEPDALSGWNVFARVRDFRFAAERVGSDHVPGEGYASLWIDDEWAGRVYGNSYHIERLEPGRHELRYVLHANDHRIYVSRRRKISGRTVLRVPDPAVSSQTIADATVTPAGRVANLSESPPSIDLRVEPDDQGGFNVLAAIDGFHFISPEAVGQSRREGEGYAYLYLDGRQVARLYQPAFHLSELPAGTHEVMISLHANDRSLWAADGRPVASAVRIEVGSTGAETDTATTPQE